jgi:signal transduction histidine kinase
MKEFSHPGSGKMAPEDLNKAIQTTITVARNEWKYHADIQLNLEEDLPLTPSLIGPVKQCILNLIVNAAHTIQDKVSAGLIEKGCITIRTHHTAERSIIEVEDNGMGIPKHARARIFDPFFTTKEVGKGTGQGLSSAYDIVVRKHKGKLHFKTEEGKGSTFSIELPLGASRADPQNGLHEDDAAQQHETHPL